MSLTVKQDNFCLAYLETGNASEAYRRSFNASKMKPNSVNRSAKELLDNPNITARLARMRQPALEKASVSLEKVIGETANLAFSDIRLFYDDRGRIKPISEWTPEMSVAVESFNQDECGNVTKLKLWDKNSALDKLCRHCVGANNAQQANPITDMLALISQSKR